MSIYSYKYLVRKRSASDDTCESSAIGVCVELRVVDKPTATSAVRAAARIRVVWPTAAMFLGLSLILGATASAGKFGAPLTSSSLAALVGAATLIGGITGIILGRGTSVASTSAHLPAVSAVLAGLVVAVATGDASWGRILPLVVVSLILVGFTVRHARTPDPVVWPFVVALATVPLLFIPVAMAGLGNPADSLLVHHEAFRALLSMENPYVVVSVANSNPFTAPGSVINGYPYPPMAMAMFAPAVVVGSAAFVTVLGMAGVAGLLGGMLWRTPYRVGAVGLAAIAAGFPGSGFMSFVGSTDPMSVLMFTISAVTFRKHPVISAVMFGLAAASKQYLMLMLGALVFAHFVGKLRYTAIAMAAAFASLVPFLVIDAGAMWRSLVAVGRWEIRVDSLSVASFGIFVPTALILLAVLVTFSSLSRWVRGIDGTFFLGAIGLAVVVSLSPQSFSNYWYAVILFTLIGLALRWQIEVDQ